MYIKIEDLKEDKNVLPPENGIFEISDAPLKHFVHKNGKLEELIMLGKVIKKEGKIIQND